MQAAEAVEVAARGVGETAAGEAEEAGEAGETGEA